MTTRTRNRIRYASLFTIATLVAMALGFIMVRSAYESAHADAVAAVTAPPPTPPPPSVDDVVTAYRAGSWTAFALAAFAVLFVGFRAVAKKRGSPWLGAFASYLAGASAVGVTAIACAIKSGGIDPTVMGAAITTLALTIYRLPDDGPRPETGIATSPRDTQAGRVAMGGLAATITVLIGTLVGVAAVQGCRTPAAQSARVDIIDCGRAGVVDLATDLAPAVATILAGDTPTWRDQLDALLSVGTHAGACAIKSVGADMARRALEAVGVHAEGQEATGAAHAREYLAARRFVFEVAQ